MHDIVGIRDDGACNSHFEFLSLPFHWPCIDGTTPRKAPVDAGMLMQVGRLLWLSVASEILWRRDRLHRMIRSQTDRDHIFFKPFSNPDTGIETTGDDVAQALVNHDVEHHIRIGFVESSESWRDQLLRC